MSHVLILGAGVVGYATGAGLTALGHRCTFADISEQRVAELRGRGLTAVDAEEVSLHDVDAVFVAVPTPAGPDGIDPTCLDAACKTIGVALASVDHEVLVVFRSTMPPGTTRTRLLPMLQDMSGRRADVDFHVCHNPEYLREVSADQDFRRAQVLTIGTARLGNTAARRIREIFANHDAAPIDLTFEQAEFQKYVHNLYNAVKISYFNEMRAVAHILGVTDVDPVFALTARTAEGMWNPVYGTRNLGPFGGACLPKDGAAWLAFNRDNAPAVMVDAAVAVNNSAEEAA